MLPPTTAQASTPPLDALETVEVLYSYDGPRIFTTANQGKLFLAYLCDEDDDVARYIVAPTNEKIIADLKDGRLSVRSALEQSWLWLVDRSHPGGELKAWRVSSLSELPADTVPKAGVPLLPAHRALVSVKLDGPELSTGRAPSSVVKRAVEGMGGALKVLLDWTIAATKQAKPERMRRLYDLPVQQLAFGSVEVGFALPADAQGNLFPDDEQKVLRSALTMLDEALAWASSEEDAILPADEDQRSAYLEAIEKLVPPSRGPVTTTKVGGRGLRASRIRVLDRTATERVRVAIQQMKRPPGPVSYTGLIRELDKDRSTFTLRDDAGNDICACSFNDDLSSEVERAFALVTRVTIVGNKVPGRREIELTNIAQPSSDSAPPPPM